MRLFVAIVLSILFHLLLIVSFFYFQDKSQIKTLWSGGRSGTNVTYVDLGLMDVLPGSDSDSSPKSQVSSPKSDIKIKKRKTSQKKKKVSKKKKISQTKKSSVPSGGIGDSDTPAGGVGPGLDQGGVISKTAPNTLALIRKRIMRKKRFPLVAKENKWTGSVRVRFKINQSGGLDFVRVIKGSGHQVLDQSAVSAIKNAAPLPYYPQVIALSLEYRLE